MTSTEIIKILAKRLGISEKAAREQFRTTLARIALELRDSGSAVMPGFGTLGIKTIKTHRAYNPAKRCYVTRPAQKRISFKTEEKFRNLLKQGGDDT